MQTSTRHGMRRYGNQIAENMNSLVHFISMGAQLGFARNPSEEWVVAKAAQNSQIEQALKDGHAPPILEIAQNEFPIHEQDLRGHRTDFIRCLGHPIEARLSSRRDKATIGTLRIFVILLVDTAGVPQHPVTLP